MTRKANNTEANLGFEAQLWAAADKLRGNMEPSDYRHVALGLIFLKYISDAFEAKRAELLDEELADAEDPEEYLAENVFWVPKQARWSHLQARAKQPTIGKDRQLSMGGHPCTPGHRFHGLCLRAPTSRRVQLRKKRQLSPAAVRDALLNRQCSLLRHTGTAKQYVFPSPATAEAQLIYEALGLYLSDVPYELN